MCMKDIYDGKIWKDFQHDPLKPLEPFLSNPNIGLLLNVDWFKHIQKVRI